MKYRICPHGLEKWKVQRRWLCFWLNVRRFDDYIRVFDTEADAEGWIQDRHDGAILARDYDDAVLERRTRIHPRVYP